MTKKEKKFLQDVYFDLVQSHIGFMKGKNFKGIKILRDVDHSLNFRAIQQGCEDLGIQIALASEDKELAEELGVSEKRQIWVFGFSSKVLDILV